MDFDIKSGRFFVPHFLMYGSSLNKKGPEEFTF